MKRIGTIMVLLIMALSCSCHKVTGVNIVGRLLKSNGSPGRIPVHLYLAEKTESKSNNRDELVWRKANIPESSSDNEGRFTLGVNCNVIQNMDSMDKVVSYKLRWGNEILRDVTKNGQPVEFGIDCRSKEINLGDLTIDNLNPLDSNSLMIIGTISKRDGSPIAGARIILNEVTQQGKDTIVSATYKYDQRGVLVEGPPTGESDGSGDFFVEVSQLARAEKNRDYAISFELTLSETIGETETDVLSAATTPLLFKIQNDPPRIDLGKLTAMNLALTNSKTVRTSDKYGRMINTEQQVRDGRRIINVSYPEEGGAQKKVMWILRNVPTN